MMFDFGARLALRAATSADHERVDLAFARFNLSHRTGYTAFLQAQAAALLPIEAAVDAARPGRVLDDWPDRRRAHEIVADLHDLNVPAPDVIDMPIFDTADAALGAIYVLEGSRLGGRMLARSVHDAMPRRFLTAGDPSLWRKLIGVLDARLVSDQQLAAAVSAAHNAFARFEASARRHQEVRS